MPSPNSIQRTLSHSTTTDNFLGRFETWAIQPAFNCLLDKRVYHNSHPHGRPSPLLTFLFQPLHGSALRSWSVRGPGTNKHSVTLMFCSNVHTQYSEPSIWPGPSKSVPTYQQGRNKQPRPPNGFSVLLTSYRNKH